MIEYAFSRLCFKADIIEQLNDNDEFAVHTLFGVFQMSKAEFYETFSNIVKTESYQKNRVYSMKNPTKKALRFLTNAKPNMNLQVNCIKPIKDLIGNEIREKIREIGVLTLRRCLSRSNGELSFCDTSLPFDALLSRNSLCVATNSKENQEKSWNETKTVVTLHRQKDKNNKRYKQHY